MISTALPSIDLEGQSPPMLWAITDKGKNVLVYDEAMTKEAVVRWISVHRFPAVIELTRENFKEVVDELGKRTLVIAAPEKDKKTYDITVSPILCIVSCPH